MRVFVIVFLFLLSQTNSVFGQGDGNGCIDDPDALPCDDTDYETPIDDGVILLIAGGIVFSLVKFRSFNQNVASGQGDN